MYGKIATLFFLHSKVLRCYFSNQLIKYFELNIPADQNAQKNPRVRMSGIKGSTLQSKEHLMF